MKTDIKSLLEFAGVDISAGKAKQLVEMYSKEADLASAVQDLELNNVGFIDGQIYVHDETTIGDRDVYWEWSENDGYIGHHDIDGNDFPPEVKQGIDRKLAELDPVKNSGKYEEEFSQIEELRASYNAHRDKQDTEEGRGDYERDLQKDKRFEDR